VFEQEGLCHAIAFLVQRRIVLEAFWGSSGLEGVLGGSGQNRPDRFAKPV
jgi:hypothetical protein